MPCRGGCQAPPPLHPSTTHSALLITLVLEKGGEAWQADIVTPLWHSE
jgi:hypothetical protein